MRRSNSFALAMTLALVALMGAAPASVAAATPTPTEAAFAPEPRALTAAHGISHPESMSVSPQAVTGAKEWVLLRCKYQSQWGNKPRIQKDATDSSYFNTLFRNTSPGLAHYWYSASYGLMSITHSIPGAAGAAGWRSMPQANSAYGTQSNPDAFPEITAGSDTLAGDCASVWDDVVTFSSSKYYAFILDRETGNCGEGGVFWFGNHDGLFNVTGTLIGSCQGDEALWAHEMGHAFGLMHSEGSDGSNYTTNFDVLSAPSGSCGSIWDLNGEIQPHTQVDWTFTYGCIPGQPLAYHKAKVLGWIPANRQYKHQGGTTTITLERLAQPVSASNYLYAEIPIDASSYYTIEARMKTGISDALATGYDENILHEPNDSTCCYRPGDTPPQGMVIINRYFSDGNGLHIRLQATENDGYNDGPGSYWTPTETFNGVNGIKVEVLSMQATSMTVRLTSAGVSGNRYYPLARTRIMDTQTGLGGKTGKLGAAASMKLQVTGVGGIPAGASAVVLNLRGVAPTATSAVTAWTTGLSRPGASVLRLVAGRTSSNLITIKPNASGQISLYNKTGSTHLIADVVGYFGSPNAGLGYNPVYPFSPTIGSVLSVPANGSVDFQVAGVGSVPGTGVSVVAIQLETVAGFNAPSTFTVYPKGAAKPALDDFTVQTNALRTQMLFVPVGASNSITVYNASTAQASAHVEVLGWFGATGGLAFRAIAPARVRNALIAAGATSTLDLTGIGGVPATGPLAVMTNVMALGPAGASYVDVRPSDESFNYGGHDLSYTKTEANSVLAKVAAANGNVRITNLYSDTTIVVDVFGWFGN